METLLTVLVFFVSAGDPPPHRNEAHYLCRLKHYWDPSFCPGDQFLDSPEAHFTIVWAVGWLTQYWTLPAVAWFGRLLSWTLIAWGWTRLSHRVEPCPLLSVLGAALLVVGTEQTHFGGEWLIGGFEAKTLAYGVLLFALAAWIDRRWTIALALLGLCTAMHALVGLWSIVALGLAWIATRDDRPSLAQLMPGLVVAGVLGSAGVVPPLVMNADVDPQIAAQANEIYVFERLSHHLAPLTKQWEWIANHLGRHLGMLALLATLSRGLLNERSRLTPEQVWRLRWIVRFAWGAACVTGVGLALEVALWSFPTTAAAVLKYYWFRLSDIAAPLAGSLLIGAALERAWTMSRATRVASGLATAGLFALCVWGVGGHAWNRLEDNRSPADGKIHDPAAWREACAWIDANLPADALLLTPRTSQTAKWWAQRAEVVTLKDIPQNAAGIIEWRKRYRGVFQIGAWKNGKPRWTPSLGSLGAERLRQLGRRYGATHVLSQTPKGERPGSDRASLPVVGRWGPYTLYRLPPPLATAPPLAPPRPANQSPPVSP